MKKFFALTLACVAFSFAAVAAELPAFSASGTDHWHYVKFLANGSVVHDLGAGEEARNRTAAEADPAQLWRLTGSEQACTLTSRLGNHLLYDVAAKRFRTSAAEATEMKLVANDAGKWELQIADPSLAPAEGSVALVMNGGSGLDRYLDLWRHNFGACALEFVPEADMDFRYQTAPAAPAEAALSVGGPAPAELLSLWYRRPATNWVTQALPIGNGDMGAMIFGGINQERVQFNHKTLWRGSEKTGDLGTYLAFGDLYITLKNPHDKVSSYVRALNLPDALATVNYSAADGTDHSREYFASNPDGVIALRYVAEGPGTIDLNLKLINAQGEKALYTPAGAEFTGTLGNGMRYCGSMRLSAEGGSVTSSPTGIDISGARSLTVLVSCATDFDPSAPGHMTGTDPSPAVNALLDAAAARGFDELRERHIVDHSALFGRVNFTLPAAANALPTDRMLTASSAAARALTDMLVFQYGRYLTIAASRGIDVPSNLQGIWNKDGNATSNAVWASDIHTNINVQMNYWPAEPTNLSECHLPLLNFVRNEALRPDGTWQKNARALGPTQGWVVNTAGNIFGGSSNYKAGKYSVANAWLCDHLWQHYAYTLDRDFLAATAWPVMRSACRFWLQRLVDAQNGDGSLECPYEYSPEQGRVQNATAHSQQLVTMLFENSLRAIDSLAVDPQLRDSIAEALARLDPGLRIDSDGLLREWKYQDNTPNRDADRDYFADDESNVWKGHRHTSHLVALYPGFNIDPGKDAAIFNAAVASLDDRGDVATGWARAWRISLWSRARNAARAYTTLRGFAHHTSNLNYDWHGGLYDNMLDAHATSVFQIEGNYGATAGIAEMLMQSRPDSLVVLPALPAEWAEGSVSGLRAMGNFEVGMTWSGGRLDVLTVTSLSGSPLCLAYPGIEMAEITASDGEAPAADASRPGRLSLATRKGVTYTVAMPRGDSGIDAPKTTDGQDAVISVNNGVICVDGFDGHVAIHDSVGRSFRPGSRLTPGVYFVSAGRQPARPVIVSAK